MSNEGYAIPSYFFLQGFQVNVTLYIKEMDTMVKTWIVEVDNGHKLS